MYIALAILAFGLIIAVHELGHFLTAKTMNVKVLEFSIGMGPKILSKQGKETLYSLRLIPFGGFCSMEGEYGERLEKDDTDGAGKDEKNKPNERLAYEGVAYEHAEGDFDDEARTPNDYVLKDGQDEGIDTPDPRSFSAQKRWKRIVILAAGSVSNFIMAFIILLILTLFSSGYHSTVISEVRDGLPEMGQSEFMPGDKILTINGERLYYYDDYVMFMNMNADGPVTITIQRGDNIVEYNRRSYTVDGEQVYRYGLSFTAIEPNLWENVKYTAYQSYNFMRMIRLSISMMANGTASVRDLAGPVGIVGVMNEAAQGSTSVADAVFNIVFLTAFIGVNVAVVNMLPIPAMDGGRILFVFLSWVFEKATRRELDPKYENYINTGAFMLLIGLMVLIMFNDISRLIGR